MHVFKCRIQKLHWKLRLASGPLIPTFARVAAAKGGKCRNRTTSRFQASVELLDIDFDAATARQADPPGDARRHLARPRCDARGPCGGTEAAQDDLVERI